VINLVINSHSLHFLNYSEPVTEWSEQNKADIVRRKLEGKVAQYIRGLEELRKNDEV